VKTPTTSSSERPGPAEGQIIVVEGMPGAGKTTAVTFLAAQGHTTVGEYATADGLTIPFHAHPAGSDDGHQTNWLTKHHLTLAARRGPGDRRCRGPRRHQRLAGQRLLPTHHRSSLRLRACSRRRRVRLRSRLLLLFLNGPDRQPAPRLSARTPHPSDDDQMAHV